MIAGPFRSGLAAFGLLAAAPLAAQQARPADPPPSEETLLRCAIWAAGQAAQAEKPEGRDVYSLLMAWFLGRYEGLSGRGFDEAIGPREVERYSAQMSELNMVCMPLAHGFSARLERLGEARDGVGK